MQNETRREHAIRIVDYAMRKGGETLFVEHEHYSAEFMVLGDFLTNLWYIREEFTQEEAPPEYKKMSEHLLGECNREEAIVRVVELLKGGGILV